MSGASTTAPCCSPSAHWRRSPRRTGWRWWPTRRWRALLAVLAACAGGAALARLGAARLPRRLDLAAGGRLRGGCAGAGAGRAGTAGGGLLAPSGWGELADGIGQGLNGLADADYPYSGHNPWARLTILLALPLALGLAATLAFWPGRRRRGGLALVLLIALYAVAVTVSPPPLPLLWGLLLLALIAAWLWLPGLERRSGTGAVAALAVAGAVGLGAAVVLDSDDPWLDWTKWRWPGDQPSVDFRWNLLRADRLAARRDSAAASRERRPPLLADDRTGPLRRLPLGGRDRASSIYEPLEVPRDR